MDIREWLGEELGEELFEEWRQDVLRRAYEYLASCPENVWAARNHFTIFPEEFTGLTFLPEVVE